MESKKALYVATCPTGLEKVLERELRKLGIFTTRVENRLVFFEADAAGCIRANMGVRTAQRIWRVMADEMACDTFDKLYEATNAITWEKFLVRDCPIRVHASAQSSVLASEANIQKIVRRAVGDRMRTDPRDERFDDVYDLLALILRDEAFILLDTSGAPLHKRGYRPRAGEAPIKETLAAGLLLLSGWDGSRTFVDPFGGSATIAIEAALIALNIAPNTIRPFAFERFIGYDPAWFIAERSRLDSEITPKEIEILCIDADPDMVYIAEDNIARAGLAKYIRTYERPFPESVVELARPVHSVTNPPYGNRLKSDTLPELYRDLSKFFLEDGVTGGFITSYPLADARAFRNRKLLNGSIECRYYERDTRK